MTNPSVHRDIITNALQNLNDIKGKIFIVQVGDRNLATVPVADIPKGLLGLMLDRFGESILYFTSRGLTIEWELITKFVRFEAALIDLSESQNEPGSDNKDSENDGDHSGQPLPPATSLSPAATPPSAGRKARKRRGSHLLVDPWKLESEMADASKRAEGLRKDQKDQFRLSLLKKLDCRQQRLLLLAKLRHLEVIESLRRDYPNFGAVLDWMRIRLQLQIATLGPVSWPPILLAGPPGVGKTEFARALAEQMALEYVPISIAATSAAFALRGSHRTWGSSTVGVIAQKICALPDRKSLVVLLDEVDKLHDHGKNYAVEPTLLEVLEPSQSDRFEDEYLGVPLNITQMVIWVATANDLSKVSDPLRSRLQVFEVPLPTREQMPGIVRSLDRALRAKEPGLARVFEPLDVAVVEMFPAMAPRGLRAVLEQTYGIALQGEAVTGKRHVSKEDVIRAMLSRKAWSLDIT